MPLGTEGHFWRGDACLPAKQREKKKLLAQCADMSWCNGVRFTSHVLQQEEELCVPSVLHRVSEACAQLFFVTFFR